VLLSHRWEERSLREHLKDVRGQAMYAVVHGGIDQGLRQLSCDYLTQLPFDGFAIGGSLGSCHEELVELLTFLVPQLPKDKPNHLLGIADERSILAAVPLGEQR
jgi:queuine tRNA-ribosyltransferase